jgi:hypothetical protein
MLKSVSLAIAAVWGFYGATLVTLMGYVVFPDGGMFNDSVDPGLFVLCLALFFFLNLAALAALQGSAIGAVPKDKQPRFLAEASTVLLLFHFTLDVAVLALVYDATT